MAQSGSTAFCFGINALYANRPVKHSFCQKPQRRNFAKIRTTGYLNYMTERRAQFYADKLGISLQHLSTTVKQVTGRNVLKLFRMW